MFRVGIPHDLKPTLGTLKIEIIHAVNGICNPELQSFIEQQIATLCFPNVGQCFHLCTNRGGKQRRRGQQNNGNVNTVSFQFSG